MTIVFLHGLGQTGASWDETISLLPEGTDCRCPNLPDLLAGKQVTFQNLYAALEAYCSVITGRFCLCGLSLGGVLALQYATEHPDRLDSLILIGAQYRMPKLLLSLQNLMFRLMPPKNFQGIGFGKQDFIRLCASTRQLDFTQALPGIPCPTLILCGENDNTNQKAALGLSQRIPGCKLLSVPQSGHQVNQDNPQKLAELLQTFWSGGFSE